MIAEGRIATRPYDAVSKIGILLHNRRFEEETLPNPFNPSTTIEFGLPIASKVSIRIYNIRGQLVKELINQRYEPGKFKVVWEGKNESGRSVASGVYFYRLEAAGKCITHKMLMLK